MNIEIFDDPTKVSTHVKEGLAGGLGHFLLGISMIFLCVMGLIEY